MLRAVFPKENGTAEGKTYPVILTRTCYPGNDRIHCAYGEGLARRGYVYVYQYCRGREQSEGKVAAMFFEDYGTDRFTSAYEKGCFRHDILTAWSMENAEKPVAADYRESCRYMPQIGSHLQPEPDYRDDVLSFVSEPLKEDFTLNGKACVRLSVESDCEDTAFTAKIMEVTPEGKAYNIRSSITTLEQGNTKAGAYEPGSVAEISMEMWNIVYMIPKGSRVRIDISSSDFPQYHVHSNQKGLWSEQTENKIAHQTIHMGGVHASCVILPGMKNE